MTASGLADAGGTAGEPEAWSRPDAGRSYLARDGKTHV